MSSPASPAAPPPPAATRTAPRRRGVLAERQPRIHFLSLLTYQGRHLFGRVGRSEMELSPAGRIVFEEWRRSATLRPNLRLGAFAILPNHLHALVEWTPPRDGERGGATIGTFLAGFKAVCTSRINAARGLPASTPVWTDGYWNRELLDEARLNSAQRQIREAVERWRRERG